MIGKATAVSCANIAFIKYWGNRDAALRLPANGSISMNLAGIETTTTVIFDEGLRQDELTINGASQGEAPLARASHHLDHIRRAAGLSARASVCSQNTFAMGAGLASSASAFAALTMAGCAAAGLHLSEAALSAMARLGSGSASRSIPAGFVEWHAGEDHDTSYAESIAPPEHWQLVDLIAMVSEEHKKVGSTSGHDAAGTSPLQPARIADSPRRLDICRQAILTRDFEAFAAIVEHDTLMMHAIMMTSQPPLLYWSRDTLPIMQNVVDWREREGLPVCFTIDAGPNVHVITTLETREGVKKRLEALVGEGRVLAAAPGGPTHLIDTAIGN
jgi:diphosphomevalonate decarboxylase